MRDKCVIRALIAQVAGCVAQGVAGAGSLRRNFAHHSHVVSDDEHKGMADRDTGRAGLSAGLTVRWSSYGHQVVRLMTLDRAPRRKAKLHR